LIPEVNYEHASLIGAQPTVRGNGAGGFIIATPNSSTVMLALPLVPLHERFGIEALVATTMQARFRMGVILGWLRSTLRTT
jgi:aspartate-semialdehyde dehydrogenase